MITGSSRGSSSSKSSSNCGTAATAAETTPPVVFPSEMSLYIYIYVAHIRTKSPGLNIRTRENTYQKKGGQEKLLGPCTLKENYALISLPVVTQFSIIEATRGLDLMLFLWPPLLLLPLLLLLLLFLWPRSNT